MTIQSVFVVGAGTMGNGIAQVCAAAGLDVKMNDIEQAFIDKGIATISGSLDRLVKKEKITPEGKQAILGRVRPAASTTTYSE